MKYFQTQEPFWGKAMSVSLSKRKGELGSWVSELNTKLWKRAFYPQRYNKSPC